MICITLGNGVELCIDENDNMKIRYIPYPQGTVELLLGKATRKNFDRLLENIELLRIHAMALD